MMVDDNKKCYRLYKSKNLNKKKHTHHVVSFSLSLSLLLTLLYFTRFDLILVP